MRNPGFKMPRYEGMKWEVSLSMEKVQSEAEE